MAAKLMLRCNRLDEIKTIYMSDVISTSASDGGDGGAGRAFFFGDLKSRTVTEA